MALSKNQRNLLKRANSRLAGILDKASANEPALMYAPAVQDAMQALEGETKFHAKDLSAANHFCARKHQPSRARERGRLK